MSALFTDVHTSPLWQYVLEGTGKRWYCDGHMCRSPFFQWSYDGHAVCNGCLGKAYAPSSAEMHVIANTTVSVFPSDIGRDLTEVEKGYS